MWSEGREDPSLPVADAPKHRSWDAPPVSTSFKVFLDSPPDTLAQACLLATSENESDNVLEAQKESDTWLQTPLVSALSLHIDDDVI